MVIQITSELPKRAVLVSGAVLGLFSITVPMFRIGMFYLNAHTLMGLAVAMMVAGLIIVRRDKEISVQATWMMSLGALVGTTSRIEGILLVALLVLCLLYQLDLAVNSRKPLIAVSVVAGGSLSLWMAVTNSPVVMEFGLSLWSLNLGLVAAMFAIMLPIPQAIRRRLPTFAGFLVLSLLLFEVATSYSPWSTATAQWPNLALGEGGWATAAIVFVLFTMILGWQNRSSDYRWLQILVWLAIGIIFYSKTFDGGLGRESFYDSVNRMLLHIMPVILTVSIVGFAELLAGNNARTPSGSKNRSTS
jgi:hypothetical protein